MTNQQSTAEILRIRAALMQASIGAEKSIELRRFILEEIKPMLVQDIAAAQNCSESEVDIWFPEISSDIAVSLKEKYARLLLDKEASLAQEEGGVK